ncbi:MAG: hypothetical protein BroJett038_21690 [Chloroflexota bacterium]|nr:MAG: hypothetical protein BroJett038_21690 [Chloroflexota bacterium]
MSTNVHRQDFSPSQPSIDEGYWSALLNEGEYAEPVRLAAESEEEILAETPYHFNGHHASGSIIEADWLEMQRIMDCDEVVELPVVGYNRGGLLVEWRSLHGFVPASQLTEFPVNASSLTRRKALTSWIGQKLLLRVIELNAEQNRLILSERAAHVRPGERAEILRRLRPGDCISGSVTNLCDFGAFIDLGGLEGLIHISELSWGRVGHPSEMLQRGEIVNVHVLDVDREAGRIALSLKRLYPDPWKTVGERYHVGQIVVGTITNVVDFGAFACIEEGLEGLIHVSELAEGHFLHPRNVVNEGQQVEARILSIDSQARRLGLSLRLKE